MRMVLGVGCLVALCLANVPAADASGLYDTSVIVTGTGLPERQVGLTRALGEVLAKVSGNPGWTTDSRVGELDSTMTLISIAYLDRESNLPKHDEQGTRDRPYDLLVSFDPARIDAILHDAGEAPWPEPRPVIVVELVISARNGMRVTAFADTDPDEPHRSALLAAADRVGLRVTLPLARGTQGSRPGNAILRGTMTWSDAALGWVSAWTLVDGSGRVVDRWGIGGVGFDAAYRNAMQRCTGALSHHTLPAPNPKP